MWKPITKYGEWGTYLTLVGFIALFAQYWIAMGLTISIPVSLGLLPMLSILVGGVLSGYARFKQNDKSYSVVLSAILGMMAIIFIAMELIFPH